MPHISQCTHCRYRTLRLRNKAIATRIAAVNGGEEILMAAGNGKACSCCLLLPASCYCAHSDPGFERMFAQGDPLLRLVPAEASAMAGQLQRVATVLDAISAWQR